ncbi:hypothetical protein [Vibrio hippocampi]|uniref:Lipoprotein n=1 Tax=Vibrio hippocampi TaxID=654686 RepID=A0ABN8DEK9_9VIBR|nr:hypothetical protein [Vibrio hippocampi]CAH0525506.1 hypothetical protein VHP8226_01031 [Vibrio hippocampi]
MKRALSLTVIVTLAGCAGPSIMDILNLSKDYKVEQKGAAIFTAANKKQYHIPAPRNSNTDRILVCSTSGGLFNKVDKQELQEAGQDWLNIRKQGNVIVSSSKSPTDLDGRTCYEFTYQE